jgi:starch synthase (maltosyl-transferring)
LTPPLIYNLFPRLVGPTTRWVEHAERARDMEFDWLFVNPWHYPGFSGSLYAPKELWRLNPLFVPPGEEERGLEPLREALVRIRQLGMRPMMDLVVNHTAKDSPLIREHPEWFVRDEHGQVVSPWVADPDDPARVTVWGDLAEIDNESSPDRDRLWDFWAELVRGSLELGFVGFRCDAAYKVPAALWARLIEEARAVNPEVEFFAETLGAPESDVLSLRDAGFHYFFNSSKWWDFRAPWALDQHERFRHIAPSIAFPETHDTPRMAAESGGDEWVQRQRYAFAAFFSAGLMMPIGYEFGFRRQVNVVHTKPSDWERKSLDLRGFVGRVNRLKLQTPLLWGEGRLRAPWGLHGDVLLLERTSDRAGDSAGWMLLNKNAERGFEVRLDGAPMADTVGYRMHRTSVDLIPDEGEDVPDVLVVEPSEVVFLLPS